MVFFVDVITIHVIVNTMHAVAKKITQKTIIIMSTNLLTSFHDRLGFFGDIGQCTFDPFTNLFSVVVSVNLSTKLIDEGPVIDDFLYFNGALLHITLYIQFGAGVLPSL